MKALALLFTSLLVVGCGSQPAASKAETVAPAAVSFAKDVQPIFTQSCMPCHSVGADAKSKYVLTGYEGVMGTGKDSVANVFAGNPDSSVLYQLLQAGKMPPAGPLDPAKVAAVQKWINEGAKNN
jgi:cytochrome c1